MRLLLRDLQPNTDYGVQLRANAADAVSEWSRTFALHTNSNFRLPATPTGFSITSSGSNFNVVWNPVTTNTIGGLSVVSYYEIEFTAGGVTKTVSAPKKTDGTQMLYRLTLSANRALFGSLQGVVSARVCAVDASNLRSAFTATDTATNSAPSPIASLTATPGINSIVLSWPSSTELDLSKYNVYIGSTLLGSAAKNATTFIYNSTTYSAQTLTVKVVDEFGQESTGVSATATPMSSFGTDTTAPSGPGNLAASITTASNLLTSALVTWTQTAPVPNDLAGFQIRFRQVGTTDWTNTTVGYDDRSTVVTLPTPYVNFEFQIRSYDFSANYSAWSTTYTATGATNNAPSTPQAPNVASNTMQIQVTPTGLNATGTAMDSDVAYYEVYASTSNGFTPAAANQLGVIQVGPAMSITFPVPASGGTTNQTWYVKIIAVDNGKLKSSASAQATSTPTLITESNIVDATITNAKISSLASDKIIAGTGFINDITVKSKFTLGDAIATGSIESFGYTSGGSTGFHIGSDGLVIKSGAISAPALNISIGENLMPLNFADFEANLSYYTTSNLHLSGTAVTGGSAVVLDGPANGLGPKFNRQLVLISKVSTAAAGYQNVTFGGNTTTYTIQTEPNTTYIFSGYVSTSTARAFVGILWSPDGASVRPTTVWDSSTVVNNISTNGVGGYATSPGDSTWRRFSFEFTTVAAEAVALALRILDPGNFYVDGLQLETKIGKSYPSPWRPPSSTTIDGSVIRTGSIQSSATALVWNSSTNAYVTDPNGNPQWSINTGGNAQFGDLSVRGRLVVGATSEPATALSTIASANYVAGSTGYMFRSDGVAELRQLAAGSISGTALSGTALNGKTITGSTIQTGTTGQRITLGITGQIRLFTGTTTEVSTGLIEAYGATGQSHFFLSSPSVANAGTRPEIEMYQDDTASEGSRMTIIADVVNMQAEVWWKAGGATRGIDHGFTMIMTNSSGEYQIDHFLPAIPVSVVTTVSGTGTVYKLQVTAKTATTFTVRAVNSATNAAAPAGINVGVYWIAIR